MIIGLSTRWNAHRHHRGEDMIEEILALGFDRVELGYDLTIDLVPGVREMVEQKAVKVASVHNFCPVPVGAPLPHPELFQLAGADRAGRNAAVLHTLRTAEFAAEIGAGAVVAHAGNVEMRNLSRKLLQMCESDKKYTPRYDRTRMKLLTRRARKAPSHLDYLYAALEELLPRMEKLGVRLALENLPSWESIPTEPEMEDALAHFNSPALACWFDIGHAHVRQNLGLIDARRWFEKLLPHMAGAHIHDVTPPAFDHLMPPQGGVDFTPFKDIAQSDRVLVLEPAPATPVQEVMEGIAAINAAWDLPNP